MLYLELRKTEKWTLPDQVPNYPIYLIWKNVENTNYLNLDRSTAREESTLYGRMKDIKVHFFFIELYSDLYT